MRHNIVQDIRERRLGMSGEENSVTMEGAIIIQLMCEVTRLKGEARVEEERLERSFSENKKLAKIIKDQATKIRKHKNES